MTRFPSLVFKSLVALLLAGATPATNLHAQSDVAITVKVPFPFTVGMRMIAAGTYRFSMPSGPFILSVRNVKSGAMEMFDVRPEQQGAVEQHGRLVFRNFDGGSVLDEIHLPGTRSFSEVIQRRGTGTMEATSSSTGGSIAVARR